MKKRNFGLFEAFGVELEYMIVDKATLHPLPLADKILVDAQGTVMDEVECGSVSICNELAAHVVEFKSTLPTSNFVQLETDFHVAIQTVNRQLASRNATLCPSGAHPFMNPSEGKTWPYGNREIYEAYDRIFDCKGHGWMNLQSCHLNLPFSGNEEFELLHNAIILILPYLPALAASSPYLDGKATGQLDSRIFAYKENQRRIPEITGHTVPESVSSKSEYEQRILDPIYRAIRPLDPQGLLQHEWLNSRGAIARFDRSAIEIRLLDTQECPAMDLGICQTIIHALQRLTSLGSPSLRRLVEKHSSTQREAELLRVASSGFATRIELADLAEAFGLTLPAGSVRDLWRALTSAENSSPLFEYTQPAVDFLLEQGTLSERLIAKFGAAPTREQLRECLAELAACLAAGKQFV